MERQKNQIANVILKKLNKVGGLISPNFKTCYKAILILTRHYRERMMNKSMEKNTLQKQTYTIEFSGLLQRSEGNSLEKGCLFNKLCQSQLTFTCKSVNLYPCLTFTNINFKWVTDLKRNINLIKFLEGIRGEKSRRSCIW